MGSVNTSAGARPWPTRTCWPLDKMTTLVPSSSSIVLATLTSLGSTASMPRAALEPSEKTAKRSPVAFTISIETISSPPLPCAVKVRPSFRTFNICPLPNLKVLTILRSAAAMFSLSFSVKNQSPVLGSRLIRCVSSRPRLPMTWLAIDCLAYMPLGSNSGVPRIRNKPVFESTKTSTASGLSPKPAAWAKASSLLSKVPRGGELSS